MSEETIFIKTIDGQKRIINWAELNQLKKDVLWVFDENTDQLKTSFIPRYSFQSKYWEYLTLEGYPEESDFFNQGVLIIILCMITEYIDTTAGDQGVFGETKIDSILAYVNNFEPKNANQEKLKYIVTPGLDIANSITEKELINTDGYYNVALDNFFPQLNWVDETFIKAYYQSK